MAEETRTGYSAYAAEYPVYTTVSTFEQLKGNIVEALNLYLRSDQGLVTIADLDIRPQHLIP